MRLTAALIAGSFAFLGTVAMSDAKEPRKAPAQQTMPAPPREDNLRACPEHGPGFFKVAGSETCAKIGGRIRTEGVVRSTGDRRSDATGIGTKGSIDIDTRTATDYGTVRTYVRMDGQVNSGPAYMSTR